MRTESRFQPDDLGDAGVRHEVNVFVFRARRGQLEYLLVRPGPQPDSLWRPVVRAIGLDEDLQRAAIAGVRQETGLHAAFDLLCPAPGLGEDVGDLQLIEWPVGYRLRRDAATRALPRLCETQWRWAGFDQAIQHLGLSIHRQNLLQLHWNLAA